MNLSKKFKLSNPKGLGIKDCFQLRKFAQRFNCRIAVNIDDKSYNLKRLLTAIFLAMAEGVELEITVRGKGAEKVMAQLGSFPPFNAEGTK